MGFSFKSIKNAITKPFEAVVVKPIQQVAQVISPVTKPISNVVNSAVDTVLKYEPISKASEKALSVLIPDGIKNDIQQVGDKLLGDKGAGQRTAIGTAVAATVATAGAAGAFSSTAGIGYGAGAGLKAVATEGLTTLGAATAGAGSTAAGVASLSVPTNLIAGITGLSSGIAAATPVITAAGVTAGSTLSASSAAGIASLSAPAPISAASGAGNFATLAPTAFSPPMIFPSANPVTAGINELVSGTTSTVQNGGLFGSAGIGSFLKKAMNGASQNGNVADISEPDQPLDINLTTPTVEVRGETDWAFWGVVVAVAALFLKKG